MIWTCHKERSGVCRNKGDRNGVNGKEKKREAEEKISGCSEVGYGENCGEGDGRWKQNSVEEHYMLWQPLIKGKGWKKKIFAIFYFVTS